MTHSYRTLQHWDQWLAHQFLGTQLIAEEQAILSTLLDKHYGKHALLIGVPQQAELLKTTPIPCHTLISPLTHHIPQINYLEGDFHELPILTGSIDLVMLPHTLEFIDNPRHLLSEVCRVIKPEGLVVICGFNPISLWGLKKLRHQKKKHAPWTGSFIQMRHIKNWLQLADFEIEDHKSILFRPPVTGKSLYDKLRFMEPLGKTCFPLFGGAYVVVARAKVIPLTPIRLKWKQRLDGIRISTTISGHIARHSGSEK